MLLLMLRFKPHVDAVVDAFFDKFSIVRDIRDV